MTVLLQDAKQARPSSVSPESKHFKFCPSATKCLSKAPNDQRLQGLMRCGHLKCDFNSEDEERLHTSIMNRLWDVTLEHQMTRSASEADFEAPLAGTKERSRGSSMKAVAVYVAVVAGVAGALVVTPIVPREDQPVMLDCPGSGNFLYWLLHGRGKAYEPLSQSEEFTVYSNGTISFERVKVYHAGTHLCVRITGGDVMTAYPVDLAVRPHPPADMWNEVYKYKFGAGLIAALVCAAIFGLSCLVYKKRWRPEEEHDTAPIVSQGYDNPTLSKDEENGESTHIASATHAS